MRLLVLSDLHANLEALEAVLAAPPALRCDRTIVLGDLVGYGADPNAVVARVRALEPLVVIRGNHDKVAAGLGDTAEFNPVARLAIEWTRAVLTPETRRYLASLPAGPAAAGDLVEACHGAPGDEDRYVFDAADARQALSEASRPVCFFGHTHIPALYAWGRRGVRELAPDTGGAAGVALREDHQSRWLVNPGAVGQPRDADPRAAYATFEEETGRLTLWRQPYPVDVAGGKVLAAGLPRALADRLAHGR